MAKRQPTPDIGEIQRRFSLNRETGRITSNFPSGRWGRLPAGRFVDTYIMPNGYRVTMFEGRDYYSHYIAWILEHGVAPDGEIDHINRIRDDNRPNNIRDVPHVQNQWNTKVNSRNKLGLKGLTMRTPQTYQVKITANNTRHFIGTFKTLCAAIKARRAAEAIYHVAPPKSGGEME